MSIGAPYRQAAILTAKTRADKFLIMLHYYSPMRRIIFHILAFFLLAAVSGNAQAD